MKNLLFVLRTVVCISTLTFSSLAYCQTVADATNQAPAAKPCSSLSLLTSATLTFKQRICFYGEPLVSPKTALAATFMASYAQVRNSPHVTRQGFEEFPHRIAIYYATRSARDAGEVLVGALHHEDPRFQRSNSKGFWRRTDYAFLSVLTSPGPDGQFRPAFSPMAGSLSAAFAANRMFRHQQDLQGTLGHAGIIYSRYFIRAFFAEFKPDITTYARHILHRDKN